MMNTQPKSKTLIIVIGVLLVANIVLLSYFLLNKPADKRPERKSPMTGYLKNEIGFTNEQMAQFDTVKSQHRREIKKLYDAMKSNKVKEFKKVGEDHFSDSSITSAAAYSSSKQMELEVLMLQHLKAIRSICTPVQQAKFDTGFYKVMNRPRGDDKSKDK